MAPFPPTASCVLPMNAHKYYAIQDTPSFRSLLAQVMDQEVEVLNVWYNDGTKCEKVINRPDYDKWVPKIGRRFVKPDDIAFIDITEYAPRSQTTSPYHMKIKSILPLLGDRSAPIQDCRDASQKSQKSGPHSVATDLKHQGHVSIERVVVISEVTADTCRHTITGDVTVRVPGVGRMVERYVMANTVAAMNMLHTVVDRYKKVQEELAAEIIPAELPVYLNTLLQEPYSDEESQASAQTVATATGEAISVQADKAAAAAAITKQAPTSKSLERQTTKYFDADDELRDEEQMLDEEEVQSIIEVMSEDEDDVIEADDDITGDVAADVSPKKRRGVHIHGPDHPRGERTKKFFSELRSLSLSRRRFEAEAQVQALETASEMSEEASRWKRDKERWDKLWRGAKVRAAPIPKALAFLCSPLRLDKLDSRRRRSRIHPESEEGTPSDDASTPEEALPPGTKTSRGASREEVNPRDAAQKLQAPVSEEDAAFLEQQAPSTGRHHHSSALIAKLSLKREMKRQHDK